MNDVQLLPVYNNVKSINGTPININKDPFMYFLLSQLGLYMHRFENKVYMTTSRRTITNILSTESSLFIVFFSSFFFFNFCCVCCIMYIDLFGYLYLRFILKKNCTDNLKYLFHIQGTNKYGIYIHVSFTKLSSLARTLYRILSNVYIFFIFFLYKFN